MPIETFNFKTVLYHIATKMGFQIWPDSHPGKSYTFVTECGRPMAVGEIVKVSMAVLMVVVIMALTDIGVKVVESRCRV